MTRKFFITAAAMAAVSTLAYAQMGQDTAKERSGNDAMQTSPTAQPAGAAMTGQTQQQLTDKEFVKQAAQSGEFEVKSAKLIADKVDDPKMKESAKLIGQDHKKANDELKQIAKTKNIDVPSEMDAKQQRMYDQWKTQDQQELAGAYHMQQIQGHKDAIELFQKASTQLQDAELKQFAQKHLPILQQHLTMLQANAQMQHDPSAVPAGAKLDQPSSMDQPKSKTDGWKDTNQPKQKESGFESKQNPIQTDR